MTGSNPVRQDDGLLPCAGCNWIAPLLETDRLCFAGGPGYKLRCDKCGMQTCWWHSEAQAREHWNTRAAPSPARDGAEGAGEHATICHACGETIGFDESCDLAECPRRPAPPKSAPDAMRASVARAVCCPGGCQYEGDSEDGQTCYCDTTDYNGSGVEKRTNAVLAALAAPVPSPDGARREVETTLQMISNAAADAALRDSSALSPSPAVAAEADAWRYKCHDGEFVYMDRRLTDEQKTRGYFHDDDDTEDDDDLGPHHWSDETPLYATPPVRGDREAITNAIVNNMPTLNGLNAAVDAILALPVQPGAGERNRDAEEADRYFDLAGEFGHQLQKLAGVVQDAIDLLTERKQGGAARSPGHNARVILETALKNVSPSALPDRQAQPSSSEGGR